MTKRKEKFINYTMENVRTAVDKAQCWSDVCRQLNVSVCTFNFRRLQRLCAENQISVAHFDQRATFRRGKANWTADKVLVKDCSITRSALRPVLVRLGLYTGECAECSNKDVWNGKPLVIEIDHINGDHTDNRIENLRWLCPNCHSQTPSYRNSRK